MHNNALHRTFFFFLFFIVGLHLFLLFFYNKNKQKKKGPEWVNGIGYRSMRQTWSHIVWSTQQNFHWLLASQQIYIRQQLWANWGHLHPHKPTNSQQRRGRYKLTTVYDPVLTSLPKISNSRELGHSADGSCSESNWKLCCDQKLNLSIWVYYQHRWTFILIWANWVFYLWLIHYLH